MYKNKKIICVIPARLASTRLPRKMLATLHNRPLLSWVWDAASSVSLFDEVVFAIDSFETAEIINQFNGRFIMTSPHCLSGTDRLVELAIKQELKADVWINWQGDEPFIQENMILELLQTCDESIEQIWTLKKLIQKSEDIFSPNIAKIVCDNKGRALYFSRSPIPYFRDQLNHKELIAKNVYYKHIGLYAFTTQALKDIARMNKSILEDAEKLEQLRFLEHGLSIKVHESMYEVFGIDTLEDLIKAEQYVKNNIIK